MLCEPVVVLLNVRILFFCTRKISHRLIVVDCYDGDQMEPMVYHAHTLTKPVSFRAIIHAIGTQAFAVSP